MSPVFANGAASAAFAAVVKSGVNVYKDSVTDEFIENNLIHKDDNDPTTPLDDTVSDLPDETRKALYKVGRTTAGHEAFLRGLESGESMILVRTIGADPNAFTVWFPEDNEIIYTTDVAGFIKSNPDALPGRQLGSSTLGSLLSHEIGHIALGGSLGEIQATSMFENQYRRRNRMPLVNTYFKKNDVCLYEGRSC